MSSSAMLSCSVGLLQCGSLEQCLICARQYLTGHRWSLSDDLLTVICLSACYRNLTQFENCVHISALVTTRCGFDLLKAGHKLQTYLRQCLRTRCILLFLSILRPGHRMWTFWIHQTLFSESAHLNSSSLKGLMCPALSGFQLCYKRSVNQLYPLYRASKCESCFVLQH